jgi:hypothetical protein
MVAQEEDLAVWRECSAVQGLGGGSVGQREHQGG